MDIAREALPDLADMKVERFVEKELGMLTANFPVLNMERAARCHQRLTQYWIVHPVACKFNPMSGLPVGGIAIALVEATGPRLAAISTVYSALHGQGAWCDGVSLKLPVTRPEKIVLSSGLLDLLQTKGHDHFGALCRLGNVCNLRIQTVHLLGAALGHFLGVASSNTRILDEVPASLILREAGGVW